jgi:hypothetical protein
LRVEEACGGRRTNKELDFDSNEPGTRPVERYPDTDKGQAAACPRRCLSHPVWFVDDHIHLTTETIIL